MSPTGNPVSPQGKIHGLVAEFADPARLVEAAREARGNGWRRLEAYTPFPVHGLDAALGEGRSRLGWIVVGCGLAGAALALLLQWWTGAVGYPLVIGGKPLFAFEFSVPITFELTVLAASFGAVLGMLALNGLPRLYHPVFNYTRHRGATDDRFLLVIEAGDGTFDAAAAERLMRSLGCERTEVIGE